MKNYPEYVPVMTVELIIFSLTAAGLMLIISSGIFTPVLFALSLLSVILLTLLFCCALLVELRQVVIPDIVPKFVREFLTRALKVDNLNFSVRGYDVYEACRAAYHWLLSWIIMYTLHVILFWTIEDENVSSTYWYGLFSPDLAAANDASTKPSLGVLKLNVVISISLLVVILVIALFVDHYVVMSLSSFYFEENYTGTPQRAIVYMCVVISQLIQYTLALEPTKLLTEEYHVWLSYAFLPWAIDVVLNSILGNLYAKRIMGKRGSSWQQKLGMLVTKNGGPITLLVLLCLKQTDSTSIPWFVHVEDMFWVTNITLIGLLTIVRMSESYQVLKMPPDQKTFIASQKMSTAAKRPSPYNTFGVAQPRLFFKKRTPLNSKRD